MRWIVLGSAIAVFWAGAVLRVSLFPVLDLGRGTMEFISGLTLLAVPVLVGALVGWARPNAPVTSTLLVDGVCLVLIAPAAGEGFFCVLFLAPVVFVLSLPVAAVVGAFIRSRHPAAAFTSTLLLLAALTGAAKASATGAPNTVTDSVEIDAAPAQVWASIDRTFMRFDAAQLPWAMRLGFPQPTRLVGEGAQVGSVRRVEFENGTVVARVTSSVEPREFVLDLRYENPGREFFDHWVQLDRTVFSFEALPGGRTRLTHSTRYQRLLGPAFLVQPLEEYFGHQLQAYLLESWAEESQRTPGGAPISPVATR